MLLTDNAMLAGVSLALLGIAALTRHRSWSGWALGTGSGAAFLAKGLLGIGVIALTVVLLLCGSRDWRRRDNLRALGIAFVFSLPWLLLWPLLLLDASPHLFGEWLWTNNLGRFFGFSVAQLGAVHQGDFWYKVLPWATFPVLPLVAPALQHMGVRRWQQPAVQIALALAVAVLLVMSTASSIRAIYALPLLPGLAIVVAPLLRVPPRWLGAAMTCAAVLIFSVVVIGSWLLWLVLALDYTPPLKNVLSAVLTSDLKMPICIPNVVLAAAVTILWFICGYIWQRAAWRGPAQWFASVVAILAIVAWLWIPWIVPAKSSYRALFLRMAAYLPISGCIASVGLGESQRGMLDYVLNIKTQRLELTGTTYCRGLLVDTSIRDVPPHLPASWQLVWRGQRASDDHELFLLYVRTDAETKMVRASTIEVEAQPIDVTRNML
jgi:4-amino-4-deoxy-L-arabinose transferase-like glycosyltransferase